MKKMKHQIVIDASVARAAGDASMHPTSRSCRETLQAFTKTELMIATCSSLVAEWRQHQSSFSRLWLLSMIAKGRFHCLSPLPHDKDLRESIAAYAGSDTEEDAMSKDVHLLELALQTGKRVVALDETARALFKGLSQNHHQIKGVHWANPVIQADSTLEWISSGSPDMQKLMLGHNNQ